MIGMLIAGNSTAHHSRYPAAVNSDMTRSPNQSSSFDPVLLVFLVFDAMTGAPFRKVFSQIGIPGGGAR